MIHLVHEGIDPERFCSTDVGKLIYYGQGNCHTLASVVSAILLPFSKVLGIEIRFRAGQVIKRNRDVLYNDSGEITGLANNWNGKPRKTEDHTWTEITYHPSLKTTILDLSFMYINIPIDLLYSKYGRFHISER